MPHTRDARSTAMFDVNTESFLMTTYIVASSEKVIWARLIKNIFCCQFAILLYLTYRTMQCTTCRFLKCPPSHWVIESIEATCVAIVFHISLKFALRESHCLAASILWGTLRYLQTVLYVVFPSLNTSRHHITQVESKQTCTSEKNNVQYMYLFLYTTQENDRFKHRKV